VAERLAAGPGGKTYGALSANVQAVAHVELIVRVPPGAFQPPPQVDSAVVRLTPRAEPVIAPHEERGYRAFVQAAFGLRRKQMIRVLRSAAALDAATAAAVLAEAGVDAEVRPETLAPEAFARVVRALGAERAARVVPPADPDA
jgi:16S rRNA (adenine1518-N6/adenine1519-N6)-dimethyltransferase